MEMPICCVAEKAKNEKIIIEINFWTYKGLRCIVLQVCISASLRQNQRYLPISFTLSIIGIICFIASSNLILKNSRLGFKR